MAKRSRKQPGQTSIEKKPEVSIINKPAKVSFWYYILPPSLLTLITALFYWPSLTYPFQFDDVANITKNFSVRYQHSFTGWWKTTGRWIGEYITRLNFKVNRFDPYVFRITNLAIHLITGCVLFFLVLELCRFTKAKSFLHKHAITIATLTSGLFLLHPVQTQTISYVVQARMEGLAALFIFATLLLFIKAFQTQNMIIRSVLVVFTLIVGYFSCGTKEISIILPILAIMIDWFWLSEGQWQSFKKRLWFHALLAFVIWGMFLYNFSSKFFTDAVSMKGSAHNNRGNILTTHAHEKITAFKYLISEFKVILHYLVMFIVPVGISVEYDWVISNGFFSYDSILPFLALLSLFAMSLYIMFKKQAHSYISFGILWFLISVAPRSSVIPAPELVCDYKTYISSFGILFLIAIAITALMNFAIKAIKNMPTWFYDRPAQVAFLSIILIPVGFGAMYRNMVWKDPISFWQDIVIKAPTKARGHNNLGVALSEVGRFDEAIPHYYTSIKLDRHYSDPYSNLSVAYASKGKIDPAIAALKEAIRIFPHYPEAYNNLGTLLIKKKNFDVAKQVLLTALQLRPYYGKAYFNLGRMYLEQGNEQEAWNHFKKATEGDLDNVDGFLTFGQMCMKMQKFDDAIKAFETAFKRGGKTNQVMFNLASAYYMVKRYPSAEHLLKQLVAAFPNEHRFSYNLGEALFSQRKYEEAAKVLAKARSLPHAMPQSHLRYAHSLEKLNQFTEAKQVLHDILQINDAPDQIKKIAQGEIGRINLQERINESKNKPVSFTMNDLNQIMEGKTDTTISTTGTKS
jgi:protein O-mannosyl-transferase